MARVRGEGIEFADLRPFAPGDRVRRVNWRVSARRGELYVNEQHPERNSDVVLFLDSFAEVRREREGTLDLAVRAAASLAHEYLERARPRRRRRLRRRRAAGCCPATGRAQDYRIADALITSEVTLSYALKDVDVLPPRTLPPQALVVALSPLLDERSMRALADLRARGFDLAVVDVSPLPFVSLPPGLAGRARATASGRSGARRCASATSALGVPVVEWTEGEPLAAGDRGGDRIPSLRASRLRLAVAAAALLVGVALAGSLLAGVDSGRARRSSGRRRARARRGRAVARSGRRCRASCWRCSRWSSSCASSTCTCPRRTPSRSPAGCCCSAS